DIADRGGFCGWLVHTRAPADRSGPDCVLLQATFSAHGFAQLAIAKAQPCCSHISRISRSCYNSLSLHGFPVRLAGLGEHGACTGESSSDRGLSPGGRAKAAIADRKSTRLNSSH